MKLLEDIKNINKYILNPHHNVKRITCIKTKWKVLVSCSFYNLLVVLFVLFPLMILIYYFFPDYYSDNSIEKNTLFEMFLFMVVLAPIWEEFVFRFPLSYKRNILFQFIDIFTPENFTLKKIWVKYFKTIFYIFAFGFGFIHVFNYEHENLIYYFIGIFFTLSQTFGGLTSGYLRMHLGFIWCVLAHALWNLIIILPMLLFHQSVYLEKTTPNYELTIKNLEYYSNNEVKETSFNKKNILFINWNDESIQKLLDTIYDKKYHVRDNHLAKISLKTQKPLSKKEFLEALKEEYEIRKKEEKKK